jgi:hypothetical protein
MPYPFQIIQGAKSIMIVYQYAGAVSHNPNGPGPEQGGFHVVQMGGAKRLEHRGGRSAIPDLLKGP